MKWWRRVEGLAAICTLLAVMWLVPWRSISEFADQEADERPGWLPLDGHVWNISTYPELFAILGAKYGGDGKSTFALPDLTDEHDYLANQRFGSLLLFRCIATRKLEDSTPVGTIGWCNHIG